MGDGEIYNYFYIIFNNKSEKHKGNGNEVYYCPCDIKYLYCLLTLSNPLQGK